MSVETSAQSELVVLREEVERLRAENREQAARIEDQNDQIEKQNERFELLLREKAEDRQRITELENYRADNEHDKATIRQQVTEASTETAESDESATSDESMTPMERILRWGEDTLTKHVTASDQRAHTIADHYKQWSQKTPNGIVIKDNLKTLVQTATGESLAWNQIYRACRALVDFAQGAIEFTKHPRFGWILVADQEYVRKLSRASSASER